MFPLLPDFGGGWRLRIWGLKHTKGLPAAAGTGGGGAGWGAEAGPCAAEPGPAEATESSGPSERSAARWSRRQPGGDAATRTEPATPRATRGARERNDRGARGAGRARRPAAGALRPGLPVGPRRRRALAHHQVPWRCRPQNGQRAGCGELQRLPPGVKFGETSGNGGLQNGHPRGGHAAWGGASGNGLGGGGLWLAEGGTSFANRRGALGIGEGL